jgi:hypothetical protein
VSVPRLSREVSALAAFVLVAVAVLGYLAGHRRGASGSTVGASAPGQASRLLTTGEILVEVPSRWRQARAAPAIPGLQLEGELALAPGNVESGGLLGGQLATADAAPLPAAFVRALVAPPHTEVLNLPGGQAYEYSGLSVPGYDRALNLYVLPTTGERAGPTVLACYAARGSAALLAQCAQIVAQLTLLGRSQFDLNPDQGYGTRLDRILRSLDSERLTLRRQMRASRTPAAVGALTRALAARLAAADVSLSTLEAPPAAVAAQAALAAAILRARHAYEALGAAASAEALASYDAALGVVERADAGIDAALENFALLGYDGSQR